jgi:hypothetical protein
VSQWNPDLIDAIATSDDLHISPLREDGRTYGTPTWIWSVVVDGQLYVRGYNGQSSRWHHAALTQGAGRITAAGQTVDVSFTPITDTSLNDAIDAAYQRKYAGSPYLQPMLGAGPRSATVRIEPNGTV